MKPTIIGIAGGTGSGKTFLANKIKTIYPHKEIQTLKQDAFYHDFSHMSFNEREKINFDHPSSIDCELLSKKIKLLSDKRKVLVPCYDYSKHLRKNNQYAINPVDIIIVEGIFVLYFKTIRDLLKVKIYLHTPTQLRFQRRLERDKLKRGRSLESIEKQFREFVQPMHKKYIEPTKEYADVILNGLDAMPNMLREIKLCVDPIIK